MWVLENKVSTIRRGTNNGAAVLLITINRQRPRTSPFSWVTSRSPNNFSAVYEFQKFLIQFKTVVTALYYEPHTFGLQFHTHFLWMQFDIIPPIYTRSPLNDLNFPMLFWVQFFILHPWHVPNFLSSHSSCFAHHALRTSR